MKKIIISKNQITNFLQKEGFDILSDDIDSLAENYGFKMIPGGSKDFQNFTDINESVLSALLGFGNLILSITPSTLAVTLANFPLLILATPLLLGAFISTKSISKEHIIENKKMTKLGKLMYNVSFLMKESRGINQDEIRKILSNPKIKDMAINYLIEDMERWDLISIDNLLDIAAINEEKEYYLALPLRYKIKIMQYIMHNLSDEIKQDIGGEIVKFAASRSFIDYTNKNDKIFSKDYIMSGKIFSTRFLIPRLAVTRRELMTAAERKKFKEKQNQDLISFISLMKEKIKDFDISDMNKNFKKRIKKQIEDIKKAEIEGISKEEIKKIINIEEKENNIEEN
jgi:hypothetical protein